MEYNDLLEIYASCWRDNFDRNALSTYGESTVLTYGDFARNIARYHLLFEQLGLDHKSKIALLGKNTPEWVTIFMAAVTYGATIVPILSEFNPQDLQHIINHSESDILFVSDRIWENLEFADMPRLKAAVSLDSCKLLEERNPDKHPVLNTFKNLTRKFNKKYPDGFTVDNIHYKKIDPEHVAVLNYTSGTTGFSKGVMLTLRNLWGNVTFGIGEKLYHPGDRCLSFLPLAHAYGCAFDMLVPLAQGAYVTLFGKVPTPKLLLKALADVKPNLILCVPLILEKIYRKQIQPLLAKRSMRWATALPLLDEMVYSKIRKRLVEAFGGEFFEVIAGGAPLNAEVEQFLHKIKFPFTVGYGMTECGPLISYAPWKEFKPGSSGKILPGLMEAKILSTDPANIPGEICVRGTNVMKGYYKNREATEAVLDKDGWLHTGDVGTLDSDNFLFIKGRSKTMILSASGQNIYPEEIEAKLNNLPYVNESLVLERGAGLSALVYPDFEQADADGLTSIDLQPIMEQNRKELNKMVAPYEQIQEIKLVPDEFEKTPKKSIKRYLYSF